jgi:hypothetical protein
MKEVQWLKSLPSPVPEVPTIDVSRDVMAHLAGGMRPAGERPAVWVWAVAAVLGLTASTMVGAVAMNMWQAADDPAQAMASTWSTVMR